MRRKKRIKEAEGRGGRRNMARKLKAMQES